MLYITLSECHFKKIMLSIPFDSARVCPKLSSTGVFSSPLAEKVNTSRVKKITLFSGMSSSVSKQAECFG